MKGGIFFVLVFLFCFDENSSLIFPGTKWCGPGNDAKNYDDLGALRELDMCCRQHDSCPIFILPRTQAYGYFNDYYHTTISECNCDKEFKNCLKTANEFGFNWLLNRILEKVYTFLVPKCVTV